MKFVEGDRLIAVALSPAEPSTGTGELYLSQQASGHGWQVALWDAAKGEVRPPHQLDAQEGRAEGTRRRSRDGSRRALADRRADGVARLAREARRRRQERGLRVRDRQRQTPPHAQGPAARRTASICPTRPNTSSGSRCGPRRSAAASRCRGACWPCPAARSGSSSTTGSSRGLCEHLGRHARGTRGPGAQRGADPRFARHLRRLRRDPLGLGDRQETGRAPAPGQPVLRECQLLDRPQAVADPRGRKRPPHRRRTRAAEGPRRGSRTARSCGSSPTASCASPPRPSRTSPTGAAWTCGTRRREPSSRASGSPRSRG